MKINLIIFLAFSLIISFSQHSNSKEPCNIRAVTENKKIFCLNKKSVEKIYLERNPAAIKSSGKVILIHFILKKRAATNLHAITDDNVGKKLQYFFEDQLISSPVQQTQIRGNRTSILTNSPTIVKEIAAEFDWLP